MDRARGPDDRGSMTPAPLRNRVAVLAAGATPATALLAHPFPTPGQSLRLSCSGSSPFATYDAGGVSDPIRVSVVPLAPVDTGALSIAPRAGSGPPVR